ncbi:MAG: hypothetical protein RIG67_31460 [Rhodospirillales bacterium]
MDKELAALHQRISHIVGDVEETGRADARCFDLGSMTEMELRQLASRNVISVKGTAKRHSRFDD